MLNYPRIKYKHGATRIANDDPEYEGKKLLKKIEKLMRGLKGKVRAGGSIELVEGVILSGGDQPGARHAPADIALGADIDYRPVSHIIPRDLH